MCWTKLLNILSKPTTSDGTGNSGTVIVINGDSTTTTGTIVPSNNDDDTDEITAIYSPQKKENEKA